MAIELPKLLVVLCENFYYTLKLWKQAKHKRDDLKNYAISDKIWLNSKYIKTKCNLKLDAKFFNPFWVLYLVWKQAYKLEQLKEWKIYNVF